jgi:hypothetical protein
MMRLMLKTINEKLATLRKGVELAKGDGYFYFSGGEASDWLGRMVKVPTLASLTLEQWCMSSSGWKN